MFWQEDIKEEDFTVTDNVQDIAFNIHSKILPMDHSNILAEALLLELPWLNDVGASIHGIGVADGNGWEQDHESGMGYYYPSKRSKLCIRIPRERLKDAEELVGKTLDLGEYEIKIIKVLKPRLLSDMQVLFAKYVACGKGLSEDEFLQLSYEQLKGLGIHPKKMMAGLTRVIKTASGEITTRSLMVADIRKSESLTLQEKGIGDYRLLGCGLFLPQKGIESLS
jgi:CRISPR-associated protein Cas6